MNLSTWLSRTILGTVAAFAFMVTFTVAAHAGDGGLNVETDGSQGPSPSPNGNPSGSSNGGGSGGGSGGGGSGVTYPAGWWVTGGTGGLGKKPPSPIGKAPHLAPTQWSVASTSFKYNNKCHNQKYTWDAGVEKGSAAYAGWTWSLAGDYSTMGLELGSDAGKKRAQVGGYDCLKPATYKVYELVCHTYAEAFYEGPHGRGVPANVESRKAINLGKKWTGFNGKIGKVGLCNKSHAYSWSKTPTLFGKYQLSADLYAKKCRHKKWVTANERTGAKGTNTLTCGDHKRVDSDNDKIQLFCNPAGGFGYVKNWDGNRDFSADHCRAETGGPGRWSCVHNKTPVYGGHRKSTLSVLDDGVDRELKWNMPVPTPVKAGDLHSFKNPEVRLQLGKNADISPFRVGSGVNSNLQPYSVSPRVNTKLAKWNQHTLKTSSEKFTTWPDLRSNGPKRFTGWKLAFYTAGVSGKPWTARPTWDFDAKLKTVMPSQLVLDTKTGEMGFKTVTKNVDVHGTCVATPVAINVLRARTSQ